MTGKDVVSKVAKLATENLVPDHEIANDVVDYDQDNELEADGVRVMIHASEDDFGTESEVSDDEMIENFDD